MMSMDDFRYMQMLQSQQGKNPFPTGEVGDVMLFHDRVVEVIEVRNKSVLKVEFTDAGGIKRIFDLSSPWSSRGVLRALVGQKDEVLDLVLAATQDINSPHHQLKLQTERWFADPRPGDTFHEMFSFWLVVDRITEAGIVVTKESKSFSPVTGWEWGQGLYADRDFFRSQFHYESRPGYTLLAHSSKRPNELKIYPET